MSKKKKLIIIFSIIAIVLLVLAFLWPFKSISRENNKVTSYITADIDHDGQDEGVAVVWKKGYYGPDLPFWQSENINDYGNHLFIYELEPEAQLKWGSSTINYEITSIEFHDPYLIVNGQERWFWKEFGFERID